MNATRQTSLPFLALFLFAFVAVTARGADEEALQNPALKKFYSELQTLFRKHYPNATSHMLKNSMHFEHDTRVFIVHEPLKTGEWQDPWETRGPKPGGILCDITLEKGKYQGQAKVPQTFDKRYFRILLMAPYSAERDCHLCVRLSYPANVNNDFLKEFMELVADFQRHVDSGTRHVGSDGQTLCRAVPKYSSRRQALGMTSTGYYSGLSQWARKLRGEKKTSVSAGFVWGRCGKMPRSREAKPYSGDSISNGTPVMPR